MDLVIIQMTVMIVIETVQPVLTVQAYAVVMQKKMTAVYVMVLENKSAGMVI